MLTDAVAAHPSSFVAHPFFVADQERFDAYRVHLFDSWEHFRLWCKTNRPRHMLPASHARGSRLRPDIDHLGECSGEMLLAQAREDRQEDARRRLEAVRRVVRTGHDADADLVALADSARAARKARNKSIRSMSGFFNWCVLNNICFDYVPTYLGQSIRQWLSAGHTYDEAAAAILDRRDSQIDPVS